MCLAESQPLGPRAEREGQGHWPGDHESPEDTRWTRSSDPQPDARAVGLMAVSASLCILVLWDDPTEDLEEANARN